LKNSIISERSLLNFDFQSEARERDKGPKFSEKLKWYKNDFRSPYTINSGHTPLEPPPLGYRIVGLFPSRLSSINSARVSDPVVKPLPPARHAMDEGNYRNIIQEG
jgi:hypothetical protein